MGTISQTKESTIDSGLAQKETNPAKKVKQLDPLRPQSCLIKQSKVPLTTTRSLRPRPNSGSTRPEQLPSVSVVIQHVRPVNQ